MTFQSWISQKHPRRIKALAEMSFVHVWPGGGSTTICGLRAVQLAAMFTGKELEETVSHVELILVGENLRIGARDDYERKI